MADVYVYIVSGRINLDFLLFNVHFYQETLIVFPSGSVTKFATLYKNEITGMANIYYGYSTIANDFHIT